MKAHLMGFAPDLIRAIALMLCVWAVLLVGDGRHDR